MYAPGGGYEVAMLCGLYLQGTKFKFGQLELATIPCIDGAEWLIQEVIHEHWRWSSHETLMDAEEVTQESPLCGKIL